MKSPTVRPEVELLWVDATDNGMHLEFNTQMDGLSWPLATIVADEADDSLWFEIYVEGKSVQIPLRIVQVALSAALEGVRSEAWYSRRENGGQEPAQSTSNDVAKE